MKAFAAVSGGADSTAMALYLHEQGREFELLFSDTGAELPENYWLLPRLAQAVGRPLHVCSGGSFFQHLVTYGYMVPLPKCRWCTRVLKQAPQDAFLAAREAEVCYVGIRADEPRRLPTPKKPKHVPREGSHRFEYPLAEAGFDRRDAHALSRRHGLLNPVYEWRSSVSCFCCIFQRKGDWLGLLRHHPTLYAVTEQWEEEMRRTTKQEGFVSWPSNKYSLKDLRTADEVQITFWPEPKEEPCVICTL